MTSNINLIDHYSEQWHIYQSPRRHRPPLIVAGFLYNTIYKHVANDVLTTIGSFTIKIKCIRVYPNLLFLLLSHVLLNNSLGNLTLDAHIVHDIVLSVP